MQLDLGFQKVDVTFLIGDQILEQRLADVIADLFAMIAGLDIQRAGIVFAGLIPGRPDDKFGAIYEYARYSNSVRGAEADEIALTGVPQVIQDYEANLEINYLFQIVPGWTLQPVLTYVWHPDGGASAVDALVIGARSIWHY